MDVKFVAVLISPVTKRGGREEPTT